MSPMSDTSASQPRRGKDYFFLRSLTWRKYSVDKKPGDQQLSPYYLRKLYPRRVIGTDSRLRRENLKESNLQSGTKACLCARYVHVYTHTNVMGWFSCDGGD